jgi:hypothetical protein
MALPVIADERGRISCEQQRTRLRMRHLTRPFIQTAIQKIKLSNEHARMPSGYKPKFIQVQTLMEMKDTVEEEDKDESDVLRIQNAVQMRYATSGMIKRVLLVPNEIFNSSLFVLGLHRCDCSRK